MRGALAAGVAPRTGAGAIALGAVTRICDRVANIVESEATTIELAGVTLFVTPSGTDVARPDDARAPQPRSNSRMAYAPASSSGTAPATAIDDELGALRRRSSAST